MFSIELKPESLAKGRTKQKSTLRIGLFSDTISVPPKEGISVHVYEFLRYIAFKTPHEIVFFMCDRGMVDTALFENEPFTTVLLPESDFFSIDHTKKLIDQFAIDIAQTHKTYVAASVLGEACKQSRTPLVCEFHDLEEDVLPLYFPDENQQQEVAKHIAYQHKAASYASFVRVMSESDYLRIKNSWQDFDASKFAWLPVASQSAPSHFIQNDDRKLLTYIGNMSYAPNKEGADAIIEQLLPFMHPEQFCFVGRGSEPYKKHCIDALGMVDDLEPILARTAIGLAPIFSGSGMKIKNLTYLKYGIPVITTTVGAQGYPNSRAIIIEDNLSLWPDIIRAIVSDRAQLEYLSIAARATFEEHFSDDVVNNKALRHYKMHQSKIKKTKGPLARTMQEDIDPNEMYWLREFREMCSSKVSEMTVIRSKLAPLVVLEGLPGAGKSTLLSRLNEELGITVVPESVNITYRRSDPSRFAHHDTYKYAQASGYGLSFMDRGYHSTIAVEDALGKKIAVQATYDAIQQYKQCGQLYDPTLTIFIDVDIETSLERQFAGNSALWRERNVLESVNNYYKDQLVNSDNVIVVDGMKNEDMVFETVKSILIERGLLK